MEQTLARLIELIRAQTGLADLPFNPGLDDRRIDELWGPTELPLPDDYRALLRVLDGQAPSAELSFPPGQLSLLSLEEAVAMWRRLAELEDEDEPRGEPADEGRVRGVVYHPRRFPIADNEVAVETMFLDFIPGDRGSEGQLVFNPAESTLCVIAPSVRQLVADYVSILERGLAKIARRAPEHGGSFSWLTPDDRLIDFDHYMQLIKR